MSNEEKLSILRHSTQHVMAYAITELYPETKMAMGPSTKDGFYGDFEFPEGVTVSEEMFSKIEEKMKEIIKKKIPFVKEVVSPQKARELFHDNPYKLEWIREIEERGEDISVYWLGDFVDICSGPHVENSIEIKAFKLMKLAGAYWRGDSKNKMLTRIYGTAFFTKDELMSYIKMLQEAEKYDHRKLGPALDLIHFDDTAPGAPYWLPDGLVIYKELYNFWSYYHEEKGYLEYRAPLLNKRELFMTSGHWQHYRENMFVINQDENNVFAMKPMGCPNAMVTFNLKTRSYQDLPYRLADADMLYRNESSGALTGLFRSYEFNQDDAHIFITEEQIESEYNHILDIVQDFYNLFGLTCTFKLSTRPDDFLGEIETWNKAEAILKNILINRFGEDGFSIKEKDGAFYGPKLDIQMKDALGREWQMGTIQLDFQLPSRFGCTYVDKDGNKKTPILLHRVIYGALGRFIGILIEHFKGKFPLWISPLHAVVIPISEKNAEYANKIVQALRDVEIRTATRGLRVKADLSAESMQKRIRNAQLKYVPYMIVVGDKEAENGTISVRTRDNKQINNIRLEDFIADLTEKIKTKSLEI